MGTIIREYFELKYQQPFNYSELSPRLKQEAYHLYHTRGGRNLATMWVAKEKIRLKWEKFGLLGDITGAMKENVAKLYESQTYHMLHESPQPDPFVSKPFPVIQRAFNKIREQEEAIKRDNNGDTKQTANI